MSTKTIPGLTQDEASTIIDHLQARLFDFNDLHLILKHAHWNVVGPDFVAVHEMIDPQVDDVRNFADEVAERIATLGGEPFGTPAAAVDNRTPLSYPLNRANTLKHLTALDNLYDEVITKLRESIKVVAEIDPVTEGMLEDAASNLEKFQWFVRAHLATEA